MGGFLEAESERKATPLGRRWRAGGIGAKEGTPFMAIEFVV